MMCVKRLAKFEIYTDCMNQPDILHILKTCKTIAVVGLSPKAHRDSYEVAEYMQSQGYRIIPVNPVAAASNTPILGEKVYATLVEAAKVEKIDMVDCFRKSEDIPPLADEAIAARRVREASLAARLARAELQAATQRMRGLAGASGGIALRSPVSGRIVAVNGAAGAAVNEGQTIIHVASLDTLWLEARIAESDLGRIAAPTGASFELDGRPTPVTLDVGRNARLVAYGGMVDAATRTVPANFEFAQGDGSMRSGIRVRARGYSGSGRPGIVIPAAAVLDENGQPVVYVLRQGESFERRPVRVGARDGDRIAITSGLAAGERVVTTGAYQIRLAAASPAAMGHGHAH